MLAAAAAVLGYCSVAFSVAQAVVGSDPALAYALAPYDGRIAGAYASALAGNDAAAGDRALADTVAKQALRRDPTVVSAVSALGLNADMQGDQNAARRYFDLAQKLSRRDLHTQLFMIEDAVQRGDMPAAIRQYDITLRVFPALGEMLYPVLSQAMEDMSIRRELLRTLAAKPLWGESFIGFIAGNAPDPTATAALFLGLRRAGVPVADTAQNIAINALIATDRIDQAWSYYAAVHPGANRRRSRDPKFAAVVETPSQLDWTAINDGSGLTTSIQSGLFDFAAPASVGGPMLQQLQLLPPGSYRLSGHSIGIEQASGARPYWTLRCQDGRELGRVEVPNSSVANGNLSGTFSVPAGCPVQTLVLMARPSDAVSGLSGQFDRVELAPAAR